jgi:hypothetical protein
VTDEVVTAIEQDIPWLIARVKELEAQAAAMADTQENADRLALAAEIVLGNLAHPEGVHWPIVHDHLRSRLYTYAFARDGEEGAKRFSRGMALEELLKAADAESLDSQIDRLAKFIMTEVPGEPSQSEGAVDTAIRVMRAMRAQAALDATVVEAIGPYREADSAVTRAYNRYVASKGTSEEAVAEFDLNWTRGVFIGYERVLDDALDAVLAARKAARKMVTE